MMHWRASRLVASLPDNTLSERVAIEVKAHAMSCARCRQKMADQELAERLLSSMPANFAPLEWSPKSYRRLASLARWSTEPDYHGPDRWRAPILSVAGALAIFTMALMMGRYSPTYTPTIGPISMVSIQPDNAYVPTSWR